MHVHEAWYLSRTGRNIPSHMAQWHIHRPNNDPWFLYREARIRKIIDPNIHDHSRNRNCRIRIMVS